MTVLSGAICSALALGGSEQAEPLPPIVEPRLLLAASSAPEFVPPGWSLARELRQDINQDGRPDLIMVLKGHDPACTVASELAPEKLDTNPSLLIVAFGAKQGYRLHLANRNVIPRREDLYTDDPLETGGLSVRKGVIRLSLTYWRSAGGWGTYTSTLSFRWNGEAFGLIGLDRHHLQRNSGETEKMSVNFLTGRVRVTKGSVSQDGSDDVVWKMLPSRRVATLETFGNGLEYEPKL